MIKDRSYTQLEQAGGGLEWELADSNILEMEFSPKLSRIE